MSYPQSEYHVTVYWHRNKPTTMRVHILKYSGQHSKLTIVQVTEIHNTFVLNHYEQGENFSNRRRVVR